MTKILQEEIVAKSIPYYKISAKFTLFDLETVLKSLKTFTEKHQEKHRVAQRRKSLAIFNLCVTQFFLLIESSSGHQSQCNMIAHSWKDKFSL